MSLALPFELPQLPFHTTVQDFENTVLRLHAIVYEHIFEAWDLEIILRKIAAARKEVLGMGLKVTKYGRYNGKEKKQRSKFESQVIGRNPEINKFGNGKGLWRR